MEENALQEYLSLHVRAFQAQGILLSDAQLRLIESQLDPAKVSNSVFQELYLKSKQNVQEKRKRQKAQLLKLTQANQQADEALQKAREQAQENEKIAEEAAQNAERARELKRQADELRVVAENAKKIAEEEAAKSKEQLEVERQTALDMQRGQKTGTLATTGIWMASLLEFFLIGVYTIGVLTGNENDKLLEIIKDLGLILIGGLISLGNAFMGATSMDTGNTKTTYK